MPLGFRSVRLNELRTRLGSVRRGLLEKECYAFLDTLIPNITRPSVIHWTKTFSAFATNDHPVDARQVNFAQILKQRLKRQKPDFSGAFSELIYAKQRLFILYARPLPDILCPFAVPPRRAPWGVSSTPERRAGANRA